jgi:hypothetical protein
MSYTPPAAYVDTQGGDTMQGNLTIDAPSTAYLALDRNTVTDYSQVEWRTNGAQKWVLGTASGNENLRYYSAVADKNALAVDSATALATVAADPTATLGIATKGYVDTQRDTRVKKTGDTMSGPLDIAGYLGISGGSNIYVTNGGNVQAGGFVVNQAGGVVNMNGLRVQSVGTPTAATDAATKVYVDAVADTGYTRNGWSNYSGAYSGAFKHGTVVTLYASIFFSGKVLAANTEYVVGQTSVGYRPAVTIIFPVIWVDSSPITQTVGYGYITTAGQIVAATSTYGFTMVSADSLSWNATFATN